MVTISAKDLDDTPASHRSALKWFAAQAGSVVPWQPVLSDGTRLFSTPKGIYKPAGSLYALSVRQTLAGEYPDRDPIHRDNGTWTYAYHQEGSDPIDVKRYFTNLGLLACMEHGVPIGVARQVKSKPGTSYEILGVAMVTQWSDGFFYLCGLSHVR
ncbi:hypothetical protein [Burkholderia stagnalis]|uniref:hypothetical protein n=1 Tax=Burkholderia stagnalis TaxID=1503054 RepID=UPI000F55B8BE|nr:hypothetical protein [Burkholderia stagnalis]